MNSPPFELPKRRVERMPSASRAVRGTGDPCFAALEVPAAGAPGVRDGTLAPGM